MSKIPAVSMKVWKQLYSIAGEFRALRPWDWMNDWEIFGVQSRDGHETGYCVVLGSLGEVLALCVYRGSTGLAFHQRIASEDPVNPDDLLGCQNYVMAEFVSKAELETEDRRIIKALGLRYVGDRQYPKFRSHLPGYFPWYLTEEEARFTTLAFECAIDACEKCREDPNYLQGSEEGKYLTYTLDRSGEEGNSFSKVWLLPALAQEADTTLPPVEAERLTRKDFKKDSIWEAHFFFLPSAIHDRDRPYLPQLVMITQQSTGIVLSMEMIPPEESPYSSIERKLIAAMNDTGLLPQELHVLEERLAHALQPLAQALDFRVLLKKDLPALFEARRELKKAMRAGLLSRKK